VRGDDGVRCLGLERGDVQRDAGRDDQIALRGEGAQQVGIAQVTNPPAGVEDEAGRDQPL
jgi:hypothetical protein